MKNTTILMFLLTVLVFTKSVKAQCSNQGTSQGTITPTTSWQTITTNSNQYLKFNAVVGDVYEFSYCPCNGGNMPYSGELSLDSSNAVPTGTSFVTSNEGYCADANNAPQIIWQCTVSGPYKVLTTLAGCATTTGQTATMAYISYTPSLCYTEAATAYSPDDFTAGTQPAGLNADDDVAKKDQAIGFSFCFNGIYYDSVLLSTNGYILFTGSCDVRDQAKLNGVPSSYTTQKLHFSNTTYTAFMTPGVMFPWIDATPNNNGSILVKSYGTAPNRHVTVSYDSVSLFDCNGATVAHDSLMTSEVQLYETSNKIEIQTFHATHCPAWAATGGNGTEGIIDQTGFAAVVVPGRNHTAFVADKEAWVFTPSCCTVLPIQLLNFSCSDTSKGVSLHWATATETNTDHFTIERSIDGVQYTPCAQLPSAGNSETTLYYSYVDTNAPNGSVYYRLEETDLDGKSEIYGETVCSFTKTEYGDIFPNPNYGSFTIELGPNVFTQTVTITDITGKQVYYHQYEPNPNPANYTINLPGSCKGVYIAKILANNEQVIAVKRLVVY